jgi:hypothetical protein
MSTKQSTPTLLKTTPHLETQQILPLASSPHDWVQLTFECDDVSKIRRVFVVFSGITLYNLHRIIQIAAGYEDNIGLEHYFLIKSQRYGSGVGDSTKRLSDRKTRLMQVIQNTGESFQYYYGLLKCSLVVVATKIGTKEKISWLPRICSGSVGTFPPELSCTDIQQITRFIPSRHIDIDSLNKIYMHERFGANQITNKNEKREGPSILCQSTQPHSTISLIYKRPILDLYDSEDSEEEEEVNKENPSKMMKNNNNQRKPVPVLEGLKYQTPSIRTLGKSPLKRTLGKSPLSPITNMNTSFVISLLSPNNNEH